MNFYETATNINYTSLFSINNRYFNNIVTS